MSERKTGITEKLSVELVPLTCRVSSLRKILPKDQWSRISKGLILQADDQCQICGRNERGQRLLLNEKWDFDDDTHTQRLLAIQAVCFWCYEVRHMGLARKEGNGLRAARHLARVNSWGKQPTVDYVTAAFSTWRERSQVQWVLDQQSIDSIIEESLTVPVKAASSVPVAPIKPEKQLLSLQATKPRNDFFNLPDLSMELDKRGYIRYRSASRFSGLSKVLVLSAVVLGALAIHATVRPEALVGSALPAETLRVASLLAVAIFVLLVVVPTIIYALRRRKPPTRATLRQEPFRALPPSKSDNARWVKEADVLCWWDGKRWTGHYQPATARPGWYPLRSGAELRWWNGFAWTDHTARPKGWVPTTPKSRTLSWWDDKMLHEQIRPIPVRSKVRPKDRSQVGVLARIDYTSRREPAIVRFRDAKGRSKEVAYPFSDLRRL